MEHEPRGTAPFPNGDVRPALVPQEGRWSFEKDGVTTVSQVSATSADTYGPARMCFLWWSLLDGRTGTPAAALNRLAENAGSISDRSRPNVWLVIAIAHAMIAAFIEPIQMRHAPVIAGICTLVRSGAAEPAATNSEQTLQWAFLASQRAALTRSMTMARMLCPAVRAMTAAIGDHVHARSGLFALEILPARSGAYY